MTTISKCNLGCGPVQPDEWLNMDLRQWDPMCVYDITEPPAACWLEAFDVIVMNHVLQMIAHNEVEEVLVHVRSMLKTGGVARLIVPDFTAAVRMWNNDYDPWFDMISREQEPTIDDALCAYLSQAGTTKSFYTHDRLRMVLHRAGFRAVEFVSYGRTRSPWPEATELDSRVDESIFVEAFA